MRRAALLALLILGCVRAAEAVSIRDLIELSRSGLGEEVLLALIEVERGVYAIDPATIKSLKEAGVSDRVIAALIRSGREELRPERPPVAVEEERSPGPPVVVIEHHGPPQIQEVLVPVPVYVGVPAVLPRSGHGYGRRQRVEPTFVPFQSGLPAVRPSAEQPTREPVYWGFGGKLRPDAWKPDGHRPGRPRPDDRK